MVHQPDRAVALQQQVVRQLADRRRLAARVALDRHQQLMLDVGQADRTGPILAPALKTAKGDAEGEQVLEVLPGGLRQGTPPFVRVPEAP